MTSFKTMAKTGSDFAIILFQPISDEIDNITVDIWVDDMKLRTFICDPADTSVTIQPLAEGKYKYKVSQITEDDVFSATGEFKIVDVHKTDKLYQGPGCITY